MQTRLVDLVLNLLRKNQYTTTTPNADELYLVTDDVGITSGDVTNALGYTPYNATNPNGYINSSQVGNGTITLKQDDDVNVFTVNQTSNQTINLKGLYDYYNFSGLSIQGAPYINGAVISDLTEADYPYMSNFVTLPTHWEIWIKFTTGFVPSDNDEELQYLIGGNSAYPDFAVYLNDLDEIQIKTGGVTKNTDFAVSSNTTYYLRMIWNLDDTYAYMAGLNVFLYNANKQYIDDVVLSGLSTVAGMQLWFGATYSANRGFDGSIDFTETYINKINYDSEHDEGTAELLWKGAEWILDTKADIDLNNVTNVGTSRSAGWAMPSNTYKELTLSSSDTYYAAPANGYFSLSKTSNGANQFMNMYIVPSNDTTRLLAMTKFTSANGVTLASSIPAKKGQRCLISYTTGGTTNFFRFIYAVGSESEVS